MQSTTRSRQPLFPARDAQRHRVHRTFRRGPLLCLGGGILLLALLLVVFELPGYTAIPVQAHSSWSQSTFTIPVASATGTVLIQKTAPVPIPTSQATPSVPTFNASHALVRLYQLDGSQYNSLADANTWSYSACSAAALTEVINAWGNYHYRIADILKVEANIGAITPALGLTTEAGIANTAAQFGFQTSWGHTRSLDQVIATANAGKPVIVSWPPATYEGGHIVVVTGGNATTVNLADSSRYDRPSVSRAQFSAWWQGFSAILTPSPYNIVGKPTISAAYIDRVLTNAHSPGAGLGQTIINLGKQYGIDPVFLIAIFQHESAFGTTGEAHFTFSPGNERCIKERPCVNNLTPPGPCESGQSCYAQMQNWPDGFDRLCFLLLNGYVRGEITGNYMVDIGEIIPTFAPKDDGNDTQAYIQILKQDVVTMRQQSQIA